MRRTVRRRCWRTGEREASKRGLHHEARKRQVEAQRAHEAQEQHANRLADKAYVKQLRCCVLLQVSV